MSKSVILYPENLYGEIYNYISGMDTSSAQLVFCEKFDEKSHIWNLEKHHHDYIEFIYFLDGKARIDVPGKEVNLSFCDIIAYPPGVLHQEFLDIRSHQEIICIGITAPSSNRIETSFELYDKTGKFRWLFDQIYSENLIKHEGFEELICNYIKIFILLLKQHFKKVEFDGLDMFNRCLHYIHGHYTDDLTVEKLSSLVFVSPSYLNRVFQKQMGISPMNYVNAYRIETAKRLLRSSSFSVTEISDYSGFRDQKYFSRIFKKHTNMSPRDYRKSQNGNL